MTVRYTTRDITTRRHDTSHRSARQDYTALRHGTGRDNMSSQPYRAAHAMRGDGHETRRDTAASHMRGCLVSSLSRFVSPCAMCEGVVSRLVSSNGRRHVVCSNGLAECSGVVCYLILCDVVWCCLVLPHTVARYTCVTLVALVIAVVVRLDNDDDNDNDDNTHTHTHTWSP